MRLRDLDATFLEVSPDGLTHTFMGDQLVNNGKRADGIMFEYPKPGCHPGHVVICWFTGVPASITPGPGRWNPQGTGLDDLTFVPPGAVSVQLRGGCDWHGFVRNGDAT